MCRQGLQRWPDSSRLKEILARELAKDSPQEAASLLRESLCAGEATADTAWQYLTTTQQPADVAAREAVQAAPEPHRENLAELFAEVMDGPQLLPWYESHLTWAVDEFPDSSMLRYLLAMYYNINDQPQRAVPLAEQVYERNPDRPEAARLLGRCLIDREPRRALKYLEEVCERNRSADYLFDLARCHLVAGNSARSCELHWEILGQNPFLAASWTNLYLCDAPRDRLWPLLIPILDQGYGVEDEYFVVAAVQIAVELNRQLSPSWLQVAAQRWSVLKTHPGFRDERPRLRESLLAWRSVRPADIQDGMEIPDRWLNQVRSRFGWPGRRWIPTS